MTVIPMHRRRARGAPSAAPTGDGPKDIQGHFRSPTGRNGVMTGTYRLERLEGAAEPGPATTAYGVFTGRLVDADGTVIGRSSRRQRAPAGATSEHRLVVGPVEVDLLGLTVHVPAFPLSDGAVTGASRDAIG